MGRLSKGYGKKCQILRGCMVSRLCHAWYNAGMDTNTILQKHLRAAVLGDASSIHWLKKHKHVEVELGEVLSYVLKPPRVIDTGQPPVKRVRKSVRTRRSAWRTCRQPKPRRSKSTPSSTALLARMHASLSGHATAASRSTGRAANGSRGSTARR